MTTSNKVNLLSAKELLLDWVSGQGATGKTPDTWEHVEDGKLHGKTVSLAILTAIAEMKTVGSVISFDSSIDRGYLSKNHLDQHETSTKAPANNPLVSTKVNLTSSQLWDNYIKLGIDSKNFETISQAVEDFYNVTDKTTKSDLMALLQTFTDCFLNPVQLDVFNVKRIDEEQAAIKFKALTDLGFYNINPMLAGIYCARLPLLELARIGSLTELGYVLTATMPIDSTTYQITFKDAVKVA